MFRCRMNARIAILNSRLFFLFAIFRDGQLKRTSVKPEFKQQRQEDYASTLKIE